MHLLLWVYLLSLRLNLLLFIRRVFVINLFNFTLWIWYSPYWLIVVIFMIWLFLSILKNTILFFWLLFLLFLMALGSVNQRFFFFFSRFLGWWLSNPLWRFCHYISLSDWFLSWDDLFWVTWYLSWSLILWDRLNIFPLF